MQYAEDQGWPTPKTAYVLLWFPEPTETFLFREVLGLWQQGLSLEVHTLYGPLRKKLTPEMQKLERPVQRMGIKALPEILLAAVRWWLRSPRRTFELWKSIPFRNWKGWEKGGENLWAFLCCFLLASRLKKQNVQHVHAPWASGPATAAWGASRLLEIPFSFTARAWDIHPPDGGLKDKVRAASFVRCNARVNVRYLQQLAGLSEGQAKKIRLVYNGISLTTDQQAQVSMQPPCEILALGRFVGKKGFEYLVQACKILKDEGLDFMLTLAGSGPKEGALRRQVRELGLEDNVRFPGFVPHHEVGALFQRTDVFAMPCVVDASGDRDGIPNVIMEALAHRLPVVASDVSGISELIVDCQTGLLARERDPQSLATAVKAMIEDRQRALEMASAGRARALEMFDPKKSCQAIIDLFLEHTAQPRGA